MGLAEQIPLPRYLSPGGCKIAGTQLEARVKEYEKPLQDGTPGKKFHEKVKRELNHVIAKTQPFHNMTQEEITLLYLDNYTDRCVAGLNSNYESIDKIYNAGEVVPLRPEQEARRQAAQKLKQGCFYDGTGFLNLKPRKQWVRLAEIKVVLTSPEYQGAIEVLGLTLEVERVIYWIDRYGEKLGITQAQIDPKRVDLLKEAVVEWHDAWRKLVNQVHAQYDEEDNPEHLEIRQLLLSPYDDQAELERQEEREIRKAREEAKEEDPA